MDKETRDILSINKIKRDAQKKRMGINRKPGESLAAFVIRAKKHKEKMQKEEVELDEISKDLANRYYKKAAKDIGSRARSSVSSRNDAYRSKQKARSNYQVTSLGDRKTTDDDKAKHKAAADSSMKYAKNQERKIKNRAVGMSRASARMEEVELDESKNLMKDYQELKSQGKKDSAALDILMSMPKYKSMSKDKMRKAIGDARRKGVFKEEVNLQEAPQPKWKVPIGKKTYLVTARNTAEANSKAMKIAKKENNIGVPQGKIEKVREQVKLDEDAWEEIPMMKRQLRYIQVASRDIMEYISQCDDQCVDPEEWFQNKLSHIHGQMQSLHAYVEGEHDREDPEYDMEESYDIYEKLEVSDGIEAWIKDFYKSDAPQFKGKDKKERRDMAVAAYLSAKRKKEG